MNTPTIEWLIRSVNATSTAISTQAPIGSICIDSRKLLPGQLFWAIRANRDGHEFVETALQSGASHAVVEKSWGLNKKSILDRLILVDDTTTALQEAGKAWRNELKCPVIAITGSNGKTTTKDFTVFVLNTKFKTYGTVGNFNNELGVPLTMLGIPRDAEVAVLELGAAKSNDIQFLCDICHPTHAVITSISSAHLQGFGTIDDVARTKGEIYDAVADHGTAFVPISDSRCVAESSKTKNRVGYGFDKRPENWNDSFTLGSNLKFDQRARASFELKGTHISLSMIGRPAAQAALAAATIGMNLGVTPNDCAIVLKSSIASTGRAGLLELNNLTVIDDSYNANPASMKSALETLMMIFAKRRVAILSDMLELGNSSAEEHRNLGDFAARSGADTLVFVGERSRISHEQAKALGAQSIHFESAPELLAALQSHIQSGDAVLVKGSRSMHMESVVKSLTELFR